MSDRKDLGKKKKAEKKASQRQKVWNEVLMNFDRLEKEISETKELLNTLKGLLSEDVGSRRVRPSLEERRFRPFHIISPQYFDPTPPEDYLYNSRSYSPQIPEYQRVSQSSIRAPVWDPFHEDDDDPGQDTTIQEMRRETETGVISGSGGSSQRSGEPDIWAEMRGIHRETGQSVEPQPQQQQVISSRGSGQQDFNVTPIRREEEVPVWDPFHEADFDYGYDPAQDTKIKKMVEKTKRDLKNVRKYSPYKRGLKEVQGILRLSKESHEKRQREEMKKAGYLKKGERFQPSADKKKKLKELRRMLDMKRKELGLSGRQPFIPQRMDESQRSSKGSSRLQRIREKRQKDRKDWSKLYPRRVYQRSPYKVRDTNEEIVGKYFRTKRSQIQRGIRGRRPYSHPPLLPPTNPELARSYPLYRIAEEEEGQIPEKSEGYPTECQMCAPPEDPLLSDISSGYSSGSSVSDPEEIPERDYETDDDSEWED